MATKIKTKTFLKYVCKRKYAQPDLAELIRS